MLALLLSLAFVRSCRHSAAATRQLEPKLCHVFAQSGVEQLVKDYEGRFYGVRVQVELRVQSMVAMVHLTGIPVGGRVSGTGWLKHHARDKGVVVLEAGFEKRLRKRRVVIHGAALAKDGHALAVFVQLPLVGNVSLVLALK